MKSSGIHTVCSAESMIEAVRHFGIIPFFKCGVPGWSIEELTPPEHWFFSSDELGPWDWKIDVVREGNIAYGKFLGGKAAFATVEFYAHLMNWRRSLPKYRLALGESVKGVRGKKGTAKGSESRGKGVKAKSRSENLMEALSPAALDFIKANGSAGSTEIRVAVGAAVSPALIPSVKKSICDSVMQFLEMGTWTVIGDFTRVYRGPNAEYSGWQRSSHTTPDALFGNAGNGDGLSACGHNSAVPSWAKFIEPDIAGTRNALEVDCTPEQSRDFLINHVLGFFPDADTKTLLKIF